MMPPPSGPPPMRDASGEELRTLFITGFPTDIKERELNNLMRFIPGYQASQMNWKGGVAQGFALFDTGSSALSALSMIAHVQFDESSVLRAELARKNMFVKGEENGAGGGAPSAAAMAKRPRIGGPGTGPSGGGGGYPPSGSSSMAGGGGPAGPGGGPLAPTITYLASGSAGAAPVAVKGYEAVSNVGDNQPCSTLFVGNLTDEVNEPELHGLFASHPGFRQIKVVRGARSITAFVEFETVESASAVHSSLQGAILPSSNRGGIRLQYSKNPLGKRKDF